MKNFEIRIDVANLQFHELPDDEKRLVETAKEMTRNSYAPYSHFHVGAAILMENGETVTGSNQENAAYPSGTCAERTAAFYASSRFPGVPMKKIAIAAWDEKLAKQGYPFEQCFQNKPISPCGACRQVLMEYEKLYGPIKIILYGTAGVFTVPSVADLLPLTFDSF